MNAPAIRPAAVGDAADIHALMLTMADDIPLAAETLEQQEALYAALRKILAFGQSWIALDGGTVVGFALIDAAEAGRHWGEEERLNLRYAAGAALDGLLAKALARGVPVTATVREANRSGLAAALVRAGFRQSETRVGELRFQYEP
ncbi:MAG: hypothetical protein JO258_06450 [Alphaproteobacteria bacterium]|nr:hypothetical protein [Alphaproteobacteria bacterium]